MLNIGILRGGSPDFFDASLTQGKSFFDELARDAYSDRYALHDIFLSKEGIWHRRGQQMSLIDALRGIDVVVPALLGHDIGRGDVLSTLQTLQIPFTGSGRDASRHAHSKSRTHAHLHPVISDGLRHATHTPGLTVHVHLPPQHLVEKRSDGTQQTPAQASHAVFSRFGPPYVVKPAHGSHSQHLTIAKTLHDLPGAIEGVMHAAQDSVVVEPYIRGHDASVYVIDGFRGQEHYTLPPVKAVIGDFDTHITTEHKLDEADIAQCPAPFSYEVKKKLEEAAKEVHKQLKLAHYSKIDFRVTPNGVYVIEANTHPNIGTNSMVGTALDVVGSSLGDFYHHIIDRAYRFKK